MNTGNKKLKNPFVTVGYRGAQYFCNRKAETKTILQNAYNGNSTALISIRRIGKTGLVNHAMEQLPKGWKGIYMDILDTENMSHLLNSIATSVMRSFPEKSAPGKKLWSFIKSLRPVISFDPLTGAPQASFDIKPGDSFNGTETVLQFLDQQNEKILLAMDEFQQILDYPEQNTDAWLRSKIQRLKNVFFIFSGSQQHLMQELFSSPKRPFFRSTQLLNLKKLEKTGYRDFIVKMFSDYKKQVAPQIAEEILEWADTHTYYVQQLCNRVFASTKGKVTSEIWKNQANILLKEQEPVFFAYRNMLTKYQWQLLKAIALEAKVYQPTSKDFIKKYNLSSSPSVLRSLKSLLNYELVYSEFDTNGTKYYSVYDIFFKQWIQKK